MKSVELKFSKTSAHKVIVRVYEKRSVMRGVRTKWDGKDYATKRKPCDAFCWQLHKPGANNIVAEIFLAADHLYLELIAHECAHAAWHRVKLMGIPIEDEEFEEYVAVATGLLTDTLFAWLDKQGFHIKLNVVPQRRVITVRRKR